MDTGSRLFIMTTGGKLGEIAKTKNIMRVALPTGFQPRAALGYSFVPLMLFLNRIGLSYYTPEDFQQLAQFLDERKAAFVVDADSSTNRAKQLAMLLYGRIPVIYSGPELTDVVGARIKGQICENAKMLAFNNQFPEFNHNELVGWKVLNSFRDYLRVIVIRDRDDHPRISARMDIVKKVIEKTGVDVFEVNSEGQDKLQRVFSLIQLGDFISYYLSILNKVDPTPVEAIEVLKQELVRV
jgi:glucose/mannose-6-phosphate isomerase